MLLDSISITKCNASKRKHFYKSKYHFIQLTNLNDPGVVQKILNRSFKKSRIKFEILTRCSMLRKGIKKMSMSIVQKMIANIKRINGLFSKVRFIRLAATQNISMIPKNLNRKNLMIKWWKIKFVIYEIVLSYCAILRLSWPMEANISQF